jgi:hypothetical protein
VQSYFYSKISENLKMFAQNCTHPSHLTSNFLSFSIECYKRNTIKLHFMHGLFSSFTLFPYHSKYSIKILKSAKLQKKKSQPPTGSICATKNGSSFSKKKSIFKFFFVNCQIFYLVSLKVLKAFKIFRQHLIDNSH